MKVMTFIMLTVICNDDEIVDEAEYRGRKVKLGKPQGDV